MKVCYPTFQVDHPTLKSFLIYISNQPNISKTIENCAEHLSVCPRQLRRLCRHHLKMSPSYAIRLNLIEYAKIQLKDDRQSVKSIAFCLGFSNASNFSNYFKNAMGMSPKHFRKQLAVENLSRLASPGA